MARRSTRNLLRAFAGASIDDRSVGPNVSQEVQLTYQLDNLRNYTMSHHGGGQAEVATIGEHSAIQLLCFADTEIQECWLNIEHLAGAIPGEILLAFSSTNNDAPSMIAVLVGGSLASGPGAINALGMGRIATADIPAAPFAFQNQRAGLQGFFILAGFALTVVQSTVNTAGHIGLRWNELNRS